MTINEIHETSEKILNYWGLNNVKQLGLQICTEAIQLAMENEKLKKDIQNTPTVDTVPVVRCEQCVNLEYNAKYSIDGVQIFEPYWCHELERNVCTIGYCGYGTKMEREE